MKKIYKILIIVVTLLVVIRLILPYALLHYLNRSLSGLDGYNGHIDDLDLSLYRGAYVIKHININQDSPAKKPVELFKAAQIELSVEWKHLLHGNIVGQIIIDTPNIVFTKVKEKAKPDTTTFSGILKSMMPLKINRVEINNGSVHYVDSTTRPKVDISLKRVHILAVNLTNMDTTAILPSSVSAQADIYDGKFNLNIKFNLLEENPTFDLNAELKQTNLVLLNDFLKAYGNFTVTRGEFSLYTEMAAKKGKFAGYVKPVIRELKVLGPQNRKDTFFQKLWESIVGAVSSVLKNKKTDQLATKIPMQGTFKNPKVKTLYAVGEVLRNAFIQALMPAIDQEINISSVDNPDLLLQMYQKDRGKKKQKK